MPVIFPFGEGRTEKIVFTFLMEKWFPKDQDQFKKLRKSFKEFVSVGGKTRFREKILNTVQGDLYAGRDEIRILAFRDLDSGEKIGRVVQSFQDIVRFLLGSWKFKPSAQELQTNTIYKWEVPAGSEFAGLRFILHIANPIVDLPNQTSDGYILKVALDNQILSRFAEEINTSPNVLFRLITDKIPSIIREEDISFNEDKDYLSAYLTATRFWIVKRTEEEARLVKIILERAWAHNRNYFNQVFESWRTAIEEVTR